MSRTFTNNFELATESVNGAHTVAFGYDADRLLTSSGAMTMTRHPETGLVTGTTLGGTTETHEYTTFGEPSRQTALAGSTPVFDVQMQRDDLGRITQRIEVVDGITRVFQYGYDLAGRLEAVTRNGDLVAHYTYDANGNRLTAEGEAYGGGVPTVATYDDQDRLLTYGGATYSYTANGELATKTVGGQTTSYVYDTLGNLLQVAKPNGDVITYTIDGRGRRVGKSINGVRVKGWLYADQLRPIAELDGDGNVVSRFVYGTKSNVPDFVIKNGETYRIFSDHLGSPRVIVNPLTAEIVQRMDFHAFGEIIQDSNPGWQPVGFEGCHQCCWRDNCQCSPKRKDAMIMAATLAACLALGALGGVAILVIHRRRSRSTAQGRVMWSLPIAIAGILVVRGYVWLTSASSEPVQWAGLVGLLLAAITAFVGLQKRS